MICECQLTWSTTPCQTAAVTPPTTLIIYKAMYIYMLINFFLAKICMCDKYVSGGCSPSANSSTRDRREDP